MAAVLPVSSHASSALSGMQPRSQDSRLRPRPAATGLGGQGPRRRPSLEVDAGPLDSDAAHRLGDSEGGGHVEADWKQGLIDSGNGRSGVRAMVDESSASPETATKVRKEKFTLPYTCNKLTISKNEFNFLVRFGDEVGPSRCLGDFGRDLILDFGSAGIVGLGSRVFANMVLKEL